MPHTALSSKTHVQINTSDKTENGIVQIMQGRSIVTKKEKNKTVCHSQKASTEKT